MNAASALRRAYPPSERWEVVCSRPYVLVIGPLRRRLFFSALVTLVFLAGNVRVQAQARPESEDNYTVHGVVVNSVTHAAVPHALVFSSDNRFAKLTDDEGRFEFKVPRTEEKPPGSTLTSTTSRRGTV